MGWRLWLTQVRLRLRGLFLRRRLDQQLDDEFAFHLEMATREAERRGLPPDEARRAARMALDGVVARQEQCRDARGWGWLDGLAQDTRHAGRALRRAPGFTAVALASLGLGIGATSALFAVVDAVLLRPLPLPSSERLVWIEEMRDGSLVGGTPDRLRDWAALKSVEGAAGFYADEPLVRIAGGEQRRTATLRLVGPLVEILGVTPILGRTFTRDEIDGGANLVLLTEGAWRGRFGAREDLLGTTITMDGRATEIVGVLPSPVNALDDVELWAPAPASIQRAPRVSGFLGQIARLRSDVALDAARAEFAATATNLSATHPDTDRGIRPSLVSLQARLGQDARLPLLTLLGTVVLVLLVASLNVAALSLARGLSRRREASLRVALGASVGRLLQLHLLESGLLALGGVLIGIAGAWLGLDLLRAWLPPAPRLQEAALNGRLLVFSGALAFVSALIVGALPALVATRGAAGRTMREGGPTIAGPTRSRWRGALVVAEVAAAVVLLIGASLLTRSLVNIGAAPVGADPANTVTFAIPLSWDTDQSRIDAITADVLARLAALPEVAAAGMVDRLPLGGGSQTTAVAVRGRTLADDVARRMVGWRTATPGYFAAVGIPVAQGELYGDLVDERAPRVAVVNRTFVRMFLAGRDPIGVEITGWRRGKEPGGPWTRIIGVVADVPVDPTDAEPRPEVYVPSGATYWPLLNFTVRARTEPGIITSALRAIGEDLGSDATIEDVRTLDEHVALATRAPRTRTWTIASFAVVALLLAALGLYGLLAGEVAARTQEFGVRLTLGARPRQLLGQTLARGLRLAVLGLALGLAAAPFLTHLIRGLLVGIGPADRVALGAALVVLLVTAALACLGPAWRAARVDPRVALRHE